MSANAVFVLRHLLMLLDGDRRKSHAGALGFWARLILGLFWTRGAGVGRGYGSFCSFGSPFSQFGNSIMFRRCSGSEGSGPGSVGEV